MKWLKEEQGISLLEVIASIVLIKKTNILSESFVDATYRAQEDMETVYGINDREWFSRFNTLIIFRNLLVQTHVKNLLPHLILNIGYNYNWIPNI